MNSNEQQWDVTVGQILDCINNFDPSAVSNIDVNSAAVERKLNKPAPISNSSSDSFTFISSKYVSNESLRLTAGLCLVPHTFEHNKELNSLVIEVDNPRLRFAQVCNLLFTPQDGKISKPDAYSLNSLVSPHAFIGENVSIGANTVISPGALIHSNSVIGSDCFISPGVVIGGTGFGYEHYENQVVRFPHYGKVIIGNHVEIGANSCIDRGSLQDTVIGDHVKIDNLVHVAHNAVVESGSYLIAGAVLCGSSHIYANCWIAPNAVIGEGVSIGEGTTVGFSTVVKRDVPPNSIANGAPLKIYPKNNV